MKLSTDIFNRSASVENNGANYGVEVANNSGSIVVCQGMGYADTKALCLELVRDELSKYKATALVEAEKRNNELFEQIMLRVNKLQMTDAQALSEFQNPSMQYDYYEAQKAYIKAGTPELLSILSDILVKRINESTRTLLQIALGESIQIAPKLIKSQMATLALVFMLRYSFKKNINSYASFSDYLREEVLPVYEDGVSEKESEFQHLDFTGCSQTSVLQTALPELIRLNYPGLFMKGFQKEEIPNSASGMNLLDVYPQLFITSLGDDTKWQLSTMTESNLSDLMDRNNVVKADKQILTELFKENQMSNKEVEDTVIKIVSEMKNVFDYWERSNVSRLTLTSVGIIIGAQYYKQITNQEYNLSLWI